MLRVNVPPLTTSSSFCKSVCLNDKGPSFSLKTNPKSWHRPVCVKVFAGLRAAEPIHSLPSEHLSMVQLLDLTSDLLGFTNKQLNISVGAETTSCTVWIFSAENPVDAFHIHTPKATAALLGFIYCGLSPFWTLRRVCNRRAIDLTKECDSSVDVEVLFAFLVTEIICIVIYSIVLHIFKTKMDQMSFNIQHFIR